MRGIGPPTPLRTLPAPPFPGHRSPAGPWPTGQTRLRAGKRLRRKELDVPGRACSAADQGPSRGSPAPDRREPDVRGAPQDARPRTMAGAPYGARDRSDRQGRRAAGRWSGKRDSNPRPSAWKADALAAELFPLKGLPDRGEWWMGKDSNLRRREPADLQSAPFGRSGTHPHLFTRAGARQPIRLDGRRRGEGRRLPPDRGRDC